MGLVAHPVFKTGRAEQPSAWKVRFLRRSVRRYSGWGTWGNAVPVWGIRRFPSDGLVGSVSVVAVPSTRRGVIRVLVCALMLALLLPSSGLGNSGPTRSAPDASHAKKKKKKKHHRRRHCRRGYHLKRVKRGKGKHRHTVRRCVKNKKKKKKPASPAPAIPCCPPVQHGFIVGMASGPAPAWEDLQMPALHPRVIRFAVDINEPASGLASTVATLASRGTEILPLAIFTGRIPTTAEAQNLATWAHAFGPGGTFWAGRSDGALAMRHIEFGNETNQSYQFGGCGPGCSTYTSRAQSYALRARDAINAINGAAGNPNVSLLLQGDGGGGNSQWVDGMFSAVPNLNQIVGGWTVHPYGPKSRYGPVFSNMISSLAKHGDTSKPFFATEYGLSTDNGRCLSDNYQWPKCLSYADAAADLHAGIADMHATYGTRLAELMIYEQRDVSKSGSSGDREGYFGAYQNNFAPKGAFTSEILNELATYRG
jgi:hypothetical protein